MTSPAAIVISTDPTTTLLVDDCLKSVPFAATYLPDGWSHELQPGNGGEVRFDSDGTTHPLQPPSLKFAHYAGRLGSYINFSLGVGEPAATYEAITVMGGAGQFGEIEDVYLITFFAGDSPCGQYSMLAYGITAADVRRVAEGLVSVA